MRQFANGRSVFGWGVQRDDPWHFVGVFPTKAKAELEASRRGAGYCVREGEHQKGTPFFIVKPPCTR